MIERNARALLRRVDDLLEIARLDDGKIEVSYESVDLARLVRRVVANFETVASDRGIDLVTQTPAEMAAQVDREKIERILLNLLSNAFKFTPTGGTVRCQVACREQDSGGSPDGQDGGTAGRVAITIYDSGPGIPIEMREAVFERFRQVDGGTTRRVGGTGLGLAIVKELVELHGGTVTAAQAPEGGAAFEIALPRLAPAGVAVRQNGLAQDDLAGDPHRLAALSVADLGWSLPEAEPPGPVSGDDGGRRLGWGYRAGAGAGGRGQPGHADVHRGGAGDTLPRCDGF